MKLAERYQEILNESFRKHFPGWDTASPMDPVKVFAESLSCSFAEIERRQTRFVDTVLDTLPSLFAFTPKAAKPPSGWFQIKPNAGLVEAKVLGPETVFRFPTKPGICHVSPNGSISLAALHDVQFTKKGNSIEMKATTKGAVPDVTLTYLPKGEGSTSLKDISVTVNNKSPRKSETLFLESLNVTDETANFSTAGNLVIRPGKASRIVQFGTGASELVINLTFDSQPPSGDFYVNLFVCQLFEVNPNAGLGQLRGEPWEELKLDDKVLVAPKQLELQYPDDRSLQLHRLDIDLLKLRHSDPSRFSHAFFYNAANHSLIIPEGALLLGNYTGGISVFGEQLLMAPQTDWLAQDAPGSPGDAAAFVDKVVPVKSISPFVKREAKVDYLKRFYATVRWLNAQQAETPGVFSCELIHQVENADASISRVELNVDPARKELTVFLLTDTRLGSTDNGCPALPASLTAKVAQILNRIVPLDYQWRLEPFHPVPISFYFKVEVALEEGRIGSITDTLLTTRIRSHTRDLLSPAGLSHGAPQSKERLLERLQFRMLQPLSDHSHLEASELLRLDTLILHPTTATFGQNVSRKAGELLIPQIEVEANWQRDEDEEVLDLAVGERPLPAPGRSRG